MASVNIKYSKNTNNETANSIDFTYKKNDNSDLFNSVVDIEGMNVKIPQNYVPIYQSFFSLTRKNYNEINLNNKIKLTEVKSKVTDNIFTCSLHDGNNIKTSEVFFKYSPLLDPSKYLIGKYDTDYEHLLSLPSLDDLNAHIKVRDPNNSAYVDGFFTYLTSQLLHSHGVVHSLDFYGCFLAKKINFEYNIIDDIEYLNDSVFFQNNNGTLFHIENEYANNMLNFNTRRNKERLTYISTGEEVPIEIIDEIDTDTDVFFTQNDTNSSGKDLDLLYHHDLTDKVKSSSNSECSSNSSNSTPCDDNCKEDTDSTTDGFSTISEDIMLATIPEFPVNVIALEKCTATLDALISEHGDKMTDEEWGSIILQIIMTLLIYQKTYGLTHNDLHTNNIMYVETDIPYIYYKALGVWYKVPTFGKIFKIIDFGRAIYKFRGNIICSDSYHRKGDAAGLYNFEPYFNDKKPRLEPNFSFDLCRLGCSLVDFFINDFDEPTNVYHGAKKIINDWCLDDKGRNVLYKSNGEERYPDFKLYKMIARTVHNSTPEYQLNKDYFNLFKTNDKPNHGKDIIINIDEMPSYM